MDSSFVERSGHRGAGDTAAEEALYLSKICSTVHMIVRREQMRASKVMQERVLNTSNIKSTGMRKPKRFGRTKSGSGEDNE